MRFLSVLLAVILVGTTAVGIAQAQRKIKKPRRKPVIVKQPSLPIKNDVDPIDFKVLLENDQSGIEEPFIFVAGNQDQYNDLKNITQNLPAEAIDFTQTAVVAVFAGQKPTPGYKISFEKTATGITDKIATSIKVNLTAPPKGAMLAQVLTAPAKIVLIPVDENKSVSVMPDPNWRLKMQTFRVFQGTFESSGGLMGRVREFKVSGSIDVLRAGNLITAFFNIGTGANPAQGIFETATGDIKNNSIFLPRVGTGNLVENPHPQLKATGNLIDKNLSLKFESLPTNVSDGFLGQGSLTATLIK